MRSALFLHDDINLINRIKITLHDENAKYYFAGSIDEVISYLDENEIAVIFMPYNFDVLTGNEMIEIVLDHNPKAQIIVLFKDSELIDVVRSHNVYHLCQIICEDFFKIEDLQATIEAAFNQYNHEEKLKAFELSYRQKEDKYKKTILSMSSLLNDRSQSFDMISVHFKETLRLLTENIKKEDSEILQNYIMNLLGEYIKFNFISTEENDFISSIIKECNDSSLGRYLKFENKAEGITDELILQFIIYSITRYFNDFNFKYKGKIEITKQDVFYSLNIVYEAYPTCKRDFNNEQIMILLEKIFKTISEKVLYASKDKITQFRIIFKKSVL